MSVVIIILKHYNCFEFVVIPFMDAELRVSLQVIKMYTSIVFFP